MIRRKISIHAPCTGSDGTRRACGCSCSFQSPLPARGATTSPTSSGKLTTYFNPRSLHGERLSGRLTSRRAAPISIHAPCTGSDRVCCTQKSTSITFQSTLPARGATVIPARIIRAQRHFNPRSLHWERPPTTSWKIRTSRFQSTLPARGATQKRSAFQELVCHFNPRSLHGERPKGQVYPNRQPYFNPRSLHGERQAVFNRFRGYIRISIHAPCTGSDQVRFPNISQLIISIHAPCTGSDIL